MIGVEDDRQSAAFEAAAVGCQEAEKSRVRMWIGRRQAAERAPPRACPSERLEVERNRPARVDGQPRVRLHEFADARIDTCLPLQHADVLNGKVLVGQLHDSPRTKGDWRSGALTLTPSVMHSVTG
jgi:hypothetical protein